MTDRRVSFQSAAGIRPAMPRWAWAGRIPTGAPTILAGREGLGKSTLCVRLCAAASRGELDGDLFGEPVHVVYASAEDSPAATLVPRLLAAGADLDHVSLLNVTVGNGGDELSATLTLPDDIPGLKKGIAETGARVLIFDPWVSYVPSKFNTYRDQDVRRVMAPLARLATEFDMALILVVHLNKGESLDALQRIGGSVGISAAARSVLLFARDPDDPEGDAGARRVIGHPKCNVGPRQASLRARIEPAVVDGDAGETIPTSRIVLLDESDQSPSDLLAPASTTDERTARDEAADFLRAELASGPVQVKTLQARANDAGLNWRTVERAKGQVCKRARRDGSHWVWELKADTPITPSVGVVGVVGVEREKADKDDKTAGTEPVALFPAVA